MNLVDSIAALPILVLALLAGRTLLSLLPPGALGSHAIGELPATWAASQLLGTCAIAVEWTVAAHFGMRPGASTFAVLASPWIVAAIARAALLPGALVPRHAPGASFTAIVEGARARTASSVVAVGALAPEANGERAPRRTTSLAPVTWMPMLQLGVALLAIAPWIPRDPLATLRESSGGVARELARITGSIRALGILDHLEAASVLALLVLVDHGLRTARRSRVARVVAIAVVAWLVYAERATLRGSGAPLGMLAIGGAAAASVAWLRRADRRGLAFAALAIAGAPWIDPSTAPVALAASIALQVATPRASALAAAPWCAAAFLAAATRLELPIATGSVSARDAACVVAIVVLAAATALVVRRPKHDVPAFLRVDPPRRELVSVAATVAIGALAAWLAGEGSAPSTATISAGLLPLAPVGVLALALAAAPAESAARRA